MIEALLELDIPDSWISDVSTNFDVSVRILDCVPFGERGARSFVELECDDPVIRESISKAIEHHPDVSKWQPSITEDGRLRGIVLLTKCRACKAIESSDCYLRSARTKTTGKVEWQVVASNEDGLRDLFKGLEEGGCSIKLISKKQLDDTSFVTRKQETAIRAALDNGYFDYPRGTSLHDLAKSFGVSSSTMGEILQRGERNMIREYFRTKV
ncbi:MAG: helix-turn-helix domain-containing protein [Methanomassiliicoccales archaeon]|nr:helix-turn-helix domain-containing protein [Methanomassiliicoccales archaeon]